MQRDNDRPHVSIDGWATWELVAADGGVVRRGEQHNLLLDQGLDLVAQYGLLALQNYACVGTGSTAPDVGQTALVAEVARTSSSPGGESLTRTADGVYQSVVVREFSAAQVGGRNLTEWGFSPNGVGDLAVRELFRDANGTPITITPAADQQLRIKYTMQHTLTPVVPTPFAFDFTVLNDDGTQSVLRKTGQYCLTKEYDDARFYPAGKPDLAIFEAVAMGRAGLLWRADTRGIGYSKAAAGNDRLGMYIGNSISGTAPAYVRGSFTRGGITYDFSTAQGNGTLAGFSLKHPNAYEYEQGWVANLDADQKIVKDNLHTLQLVGPSVSWGRKA